MIAPTARRPSTERGVAWVLRPEAWLLAPLVALTLFLMLYPGAPQWGYQPFQSPDFIPRLPLFALLYCLWLALLLFLLWRTRGPAWGMLLVIAFVLVFLGYWTAATPNGVHEDWQKSADSVLLAERGEIPLETRGYFEFPATAILGTTLSTLTGWEVSDLRTPMVLLYMTGLAALLFVLYGHVLRVPKLAAFAVLLAVQGNMMLIRFHYHPAYFGILPMIAFLVILFRRGNGALSAREDKLLVMLVMAAATITHFFASAIILASSVGAFAVQQLRRRTGLITLGTVTLFLVLPVAWEAYWAVHTLGALARTVSQLTENLSRGDLFFYTANVAPANTASVPLWVSGVRLLWWALLYGAGPLVALVVLLSAKGLTRTEGKLAAVLLGVLVLSVGGTVLSPGGQQFFRYVMYGSLFAAPLVLGFVCRWRVRRFVLPALALVFFATSLPTFLAHNSTISTAAFHPSEVAAGRFLRFATGGESDEVQLFGQSYTSDVAYYYNLDSSYVPEFQLAEIKDAADLREHMRKYVEGFLSEHGPQNPYRYPVYLSSQREVALTQHVLGVAPDDPLWSEVSLGLAQAGRVYDSGRIQIYR